MTQELFCRNYVCILNIKLYRKMHEHGGTSHIANGELTDGVNASIMLQAGIYLHC